MLNSKENNPFDDPSYGKELGGNKESHNPFDDPDYGKQQQGNLSRGFETAMRQVPQTIGGVIGLAGDAIGSDAVKSYGMNIYKNQSQKIQDISKDSDSFTKVLNGDASLGDWAGYGTGYVGGQALQALATGGVGGIVGKKIVEKGLAKAVEHEAGNLAAQEAAKQAINKGAKYGAGAALGASNFVQEAGSIYPEALDQAEKDGRTLNGGDLARIAGAGAAAAGVDTLTDMSMLKGVLHGGSNSANILKRAAKTIPMGMAKEGATEGIQTGIERWGAQQDLGNNEAVTDYIDSAALGALGGGLAGAGGALRRSGNGTTVENQEIPQTSNQESTQQITSNTQSPFTGQSNNTSPILDADELYKLTGIPPVPVINQDKLPPSDGLSYPRGIDYTQPQINTNQTDSNEFQQNLNNGIDYSQVPSYENWSLDNSKPQSYDNSIDFEQNKDNGLESKIKFNDLYGRNTPDPVIDYSSLSPFSGEKNPLIDQKKLSEQMGIDPNKGPMSSAAALAVDSGASSILRTGLAQEQQTQGQSISPLSDAVPSDYRQLMEPQNNGQSFGTGFENAALQRGNAQADNASKSRPQQNDTHTAKAMVGQTETNGAATAQVKTVQPILGSDGQNKWFGSQEKAQAFIDKKKLGDNYQITQADKSRFEITPKQNESATPTSVKPTFNSNQAVGSVGYAQDVAKQAVQQYQGDKSTLEESKSSLTGKGPATDLLYYKNSPSFSDVQVEPNASGDKAIVKLTSAKTGRIEQREYPSSLIDFNNFLEGTNNNASKTAQDNLQNGNTETQAASESPTALDNAHQSTDQVAGQEAHDPQDQITALENQLSNEKNVIQKTKIRKQINELKANLAASAAKDLEVSAHTAATSPENNLPEPTQAQKEAGNYKKGHVQFHGLDISIENPRGSDRTGQRPDGTEWRHTMTDHYGYIKKTMGADGDHVDSYIGPDLESQHVYVVDQVDQKTGKFDEHKVMLGFNDQDTATKAYQANFDKGWKVGHIRAMTMNGFKQWLKEGDTTKPSAEFDDKTETVTTAAGRDLQVRPKVVEASDLIASNTSTGTVNEAYPQELQPRDRTRLASLHQINSIANDLKPNLLGKSPSASHGAPIVSSDNIVESGNGRTLAIAQAYAQGKAEHYRNWLKSEGHDITGMKHPVLVRERMTPMSMQDRMDFTKEANTSNTLNLSATEQAQTDAAKLNDVILSQYQGGDLTLSKNLGFVRQFMSQVIGHTEAGNMILDDGSLSQNGVRRIQGALLYKAYSDESLLHEILENTDSDIKAIGNALLDVSGDWALMREQSENGTISRRIDVTANLVEAVQLVRHARATGTHISEVIEQGDIFEGEIDPVTQDFIRLFFRGENYNRASGRDSVASALKYYVNLATETKAGENIFGEPELTGQELIRGVNEKLSNQEKSKQQQNLFTGERVNDSNAGENSTARQGQALSESSARSPTQPVVTKKAQPKSSADRILNQDWGVPHINGWAESKQYKGTYSDEGLIGGIKDAFLKDSRQYLEVVQNQLEQNGYELHKDKRGKPEKISINRSGVAGSGSVSLYMRDSISGVNLYATISDSALGGSHPQNIQIMYRATTKQDDKQASGFGRENSGNLYISPSTSAFELAEVLDNLVTDLAKSNQVSSTQQEVELNDNERSTNGSQDPSGAPTARSGRGESRAQHADAPRNTENVESTTSTDGSASGKTGDSGRSSLRGSGKNVEDAGHVREIGDATNGRTGTSRDGALDAGTRGRELESNAGVKSTAQDFYMSDPLSIIGGTPAKRFDKNVKALELLEDLQSEGRQATPEEQAVLAAYSGWGSFGQELFQGSWEKPVYKDEGVWKERGNWLRSHLGEKSWKSAQNSITNAHYTDPHTVQAMWSMVEKMGFSGGKVLEPAMGTGNFISLMPQSLKQRSQVTGIELDITTSQIAKQLFPSSNIQQLDYRDSKTPDSFYDLVITNVPFANIKMADRRYNQFNPSLHDYFFLKAIDQVREGGIVMAITSSTTMDKKGQVIRRELARKAELITSIRLPSGAFKDYAGTSVVTDIIVLRKRAEPLSVLPNDLNWIETQEVATPAGTPVEVNQFYAENPKNILGTLNFGAGTTFGRAGMIVDRPGDLLQRLETVAALAPDNALLPRNHEDHLTYYANKTGERHNALTLVDGELMYAMGDQLVKAEDIRNYQLKDDKKTKQRKQSIHDLVDLRKKLVDLIDAQRSNAANVEDLRKATYQAYKGYVKQHGGLRDSYGLQYFKNIGDVFYFELAALEDANGKPATILERSTVRGKTNLKKPTVTDAFVIARNTAIQPNLKQIADLAKVTEQQAKQILIDKGAIFELPNGDIMPTDLYLSGNVRQKLREAKSALEQGNASMQSNIDALQKVIPKDIPYFNIETKLGATWIPTKDYADFVAHMLNTESSSDIKIEFKSGRWYVNLKSHLLNRTEARSNYGTQDVKFNRLVQAALSNQIITIKRKDPEGGTYVDMKSTQEIAEKINKIKADFAAWVWGDPERKLRLEQEYNETMNAWATPQYDGSFMAMEGMALELGNSPFNLRQHQQNAIWRAIVNKRSINAHEVGTGKTFTMGGIAIESRRYGIAKKPLLLAHNANSASVAAEIRMMYPNARVLYVADMSGINRQIRLRQIANDDWDVVVMPHSMIDKLSLSEETLMQLAQEDIAALEQEFFEAMSEDSQSVSDFDFDNEEAINKLRSPTAKEVAKARQSIIESIKKQAQQASKADAILFENLGVDMLLVDEVHEFKKPPIVTRMAMKGLNKGTSQRSIQLQFLTRYIRGMNNGNNIHTFTGTPITNTITEIYHQMRYVMEDEMKKLNIADWDGWFNSFATEVEDVELTSAGDYELVTRLAGFVNVPELRKLVGQFMDTVFAEDMPEMQPRKTSTGKTINDPSLTDKERAHLMNGRTEGAVDRPYKRIMNDTAEMTNEQEQLFSYLQDLSKEWRMATGKQKKEWMRKGDEHSPIVVEGRANKASLDVRIDDAKNIGMEGQTQDNPNSKASRVVKNVLEVFKSHPQANQVIFTETGYNTSAQRSTGIKDANGKTIKETVKTFSTVKDIVERLVQGGIPKDKIAIVDGNTNKEKRKEIADKMNKSEIRVVIGSTQTLGVGVNMQRNLRAMHHLDAPYMTGDLEQRNGRGLRQGNQWNTVLEYRYITDRLDGKRWQILAVKQRFINAFMKSNGMTRNIEGEAAEDEQNDILESLSEASGDPRILMRVKLKKKLENLQRKERIYSQGLVDMKQTITSEGRKLERVNQLIQDMEDAQAIQKTSDLLKSQADNFLMKVDGKTYTVRKDAEEAIKAYVDKHIRMGQESTKVGEYAGHPIRVFWSSLQTQPTYTMSAFGQEHSANTLRGLETSLRSLPKELGKLNKSLSDIQSTISSLREAIKQPFGQANELVKVDKQLNDLNNDLELNPVPAPVWLRQGTPVDSEVYRGGQLFIVTGHKYAQDGWYVLAEDAKGQTAIPYMEATDNNGMPVYEEHEFVPPNVEKKATEESSGNEEKVYSRATNNQRTQTTKEQVRAKLVEKYGEKLISDLERQGKLEILETYDQQGIEGFYQNGKVTLIADALTDDSIIPTFLHELGGHGGFQNMMNKEQYSNLMKQFDEMVRRGHPVFTEAKRLAERESDPETQKLEYLPYLLSLASHMQIRNAIQKGALKSFISNLISNVKAWLFDRLGMNINLNQDDMVALAERMINKSANHTDQQNISFSEQDKSVFTDAFTISEAEQQRVAKEIDRLAESIQSYPKPVQMKMPPVLLALNGIRDGLNIQNLPLELDKQTLRKITGQVDGKKDVSHQLTIDQIKQLPNEFTDPLAVLHSDKKDGLIILTSMKDSAGNPVISAIHLSKNKGRYTINELATAFGKENFKTWLNKRLDNLVYYRNKKSQDFVRQSQLQKQKDVSLGVVHKDSASIEDSANSTLPSLQLRGVVDSKASGQSVLSPDDIVNFFEKSNAEKDKLYSRNFDINESLNKLSEGIKNASVQSIKQRMGYTFKDWLGIGLQALGRRQLTEIYHKILPQLTKYNNLAAQMDADKNDAGAEADTLVREWAKLSDEQALAELMHDSTLAQMDPAKPHQQDDNYLKYVSLRQRFEGLSAEAQKVYTDARDAYSKQHRHIRDAIRERILRASMSNERKAELLQQMDADFFHKLKGVYFPLARFGKYVVIVRNSSNQVESVSRAETMAEAQALRNELINKYPNSKVDKVVLDKDYNASRDMVGRGFMSNLYNELDNLGISASEKAQLEDTLAQLYLSSLPDLSWAKHGIHRKGTAGFSQDARRAFAQNIFHGAGYLAKLRYSDLLDEQLSEMQKYADDKAKEDPEYDQPTAQRVINEMNKRHENLMNPKSNPLSSTLTSVGFLYYLGLSPASAVVNLLQTPLVTLPVMGAKWGYQKSSQALIKASEEAVRAKNDMSTILTGDELKAYNEAITRGVIDVTQAHDLAGIAQGEDSGVMWKLRPIMRWASFLFHHAERFNRSATFIAAYRLARENGTSHTQAFDEATDVTYQSHFDYSAGNRPRLMQGNVAKVIFLFKQFGQNMVYLLTRQAYQAIKAENPEDRAQARKTLAGLLTTHALASGVLGLPLVGMLLAAASMIGGSDDEPWDAEVALRNMLADMFGDTVSNMIAKGVSRATPWDISGRVGLSSLILPDVQEGLEGQRWAESAMAGALGPVAGIGTSFLKGLNNISDGNFERGLEDMLPVALKSPLKSMRYEMEGAQDKTGISILDEVGTMAIIGQALGFSPSDVRTASEGKSAIYQMNQRLQSRRSQLLAQFSRAKMNDNEEALSEVWSEIEQFNAKNPSRRITKPNAMQSYRNRMRRINHSENGVYIPKKHHEILDEGRFAFDN